MRLSRHDDRGGAVEPQDDHAGLGGIDEPQAQPLVGAHRKIGRGRAVGHDLEGSGRARQGIAAASGNSFKSRTRRSSPCLARRRGPGAAP
jgi:hypothetical protein